MIIKEGESIMDAVQEAKHAISAEQAVVKRKESNQKYKQTHDLVGTWMTKDESAEINKYASLDPSLKGNRSLFMRKAVLHYVQYLKSNEPAVLMAE